MFVAAALQFGAKIFAAGSAITSWLGSKLDALLEVSATMAATAVRAMTASEVAAAAAIAAAVSA